MAQCLHLMNAPEIETRLSAPTGRIAGLVGAKRSEGEIVDELCLAAWGRPARERERRIAHELFQARAPREAAADFLWALLNSNEFLFIR